MTELTGTDLASTTDNAVEAKAASTFPASTPSASDRWRVGIWKEQLGLGSFSNVEHPNIELRLHSSVATGGMQRIQDRVVVEPFDLIVDRPRLTKLVLSVRLKINGD